MHINSQLISNICYLILICEITFITFLIGKYFFLREKQEHIPFIRSFKKGKCAIIFLTTIPLYWIGNIYAGNDLLYSFFYSISRVVKLVVLEFDTSSIRVLMESNSLYRFTIYFNFILVLINALCFVLSIIHQRIWCWWQKFLIKNSNKDKLFIFGNNSENISIYKSEKRRLKTLIGNLSNKDKEDFYTKGISFISTQKYENVIKKYLNLEKKDINYTIVINTKDDKENITICKKLIDTINSFSDTDKTHLFLRLRIFVFGDPKNQSVFEEIVSKSSCCISYINKYQQIAIDFVDKYPFAKFMNENQIDYDTSLIRNNVNINAFLIGFGKTNQEIFLTSVANNQFITRGNNDPQLKQVNYYIFDNKETENNKQLNHNYYRYKNECSNVNQDDYLPLPSYPALENYCHLDINDTDFYNQIKNIVNKNINDENFIIIAFGSDLENIDLAHKLVEKRKEWNISNLVIFVKVRSVAKEQEEEQKKLLLNDDKCFFFGYEEDVVYNIDKITKSHLTQMAIMRNEIYSLEYLLTKNNYTMSNTLLNDNKESAYNSWYKNSQIQRLSNFYCCLSLRSKFNLMGLDYCKLDENIDKKALTEKEYLEIYAGTDIPVSEKNIKEYNGKKIIEYTLNFQQSRRRNMAIHEHLRWNSYMITKGTIPSSVEQIKSEQINKKYSNGKNLEVRRHGNLTTFDGLVEFRKIIAERENCEEEQTDVIKYDYQLLDDAYWLLTSNAYKIIRLIPNK